MFLRTKSHAWPALLQIPPSFCPHLIKTSSTTTTTTTTKKRLTMGTVFGKIAVETPKHEILRRSLDYAIRKYPPCVLAQTNYRGDLDAGFNVLANYIGVLGDPQNSKPEKIAMTAPVITKTGPEKIAMTAPVITGGGGAREATMMGFVLPSKYTKAEEAPRPLDERVEIKEDGERKYGVVRFSGVASDVDVGERVERLRKSLERDGYKAVGEGYLLARYNPPWTLPFLRTNEVMIPVE